MKENCPERKLFFLDPEKYSSENSPPTRKKMSLRKLIWQFPVLDPDYTEIMENPRLDEKTFSKNDQARFQKNI